MSLSVKNSEFFFLLDFVSIIRYGIILKPNRWWGEYLNFKKLYLES